MSGAVLGIDVGTKASIEKVVSEDDIVAYARATGDDQPLHLDDQYAAGTRFKRRIAHGMLSAGYISAVLGTKLTPDATVIYFEPVPPLPSPGLPWRYHHRDRRGHIDRS